MLLESFPWLSLVPPIVAIVLCFATREVLPSLFIGVFLGALILKDLNPVFAIADTALIIRDNLADPWNATVFLFDFVVGGMVGLIYYSGGAYGFGNVLTSRIKSRRGMELAASALGMLIFFDDYSSSVIVGNGMRPACEHAKVSRERFSYIIDSTSAPIATIGVISVWTGYQVGVIKGVFESMNLSISPMGVFLPGVIMYSFYSFFAITLVLFSSASRRDFGPMLNAEYRTSATGKLMNDDAVPLMNTDKLAVKKDVRERAMNMLVPIIVLVSITMIALYTLGLSASGSASMIPFTEALNAVGDTDTGVMDALLFGALGAVIVSIALYMSQGFKLSELMKAFGSGAEMMITANLILLLAWSIGSICNMVGTGEYVVSLVTPVMQNSTWALPILVFLVSCFIGFSTGTSWGTMAIVLPIAIPLGYSLGVPLPMAIAPVLTGGIFGDHCSPISDTTVMASMFAGSDHLAHVRTQMPYALLGAAVTVVAYLIVSIDFNSKALWAVALVGGIVLTMALHYVLSWYDAKKKGIKLPLEK
jgi:Na+/H+ antiporter NhaC